mmetsp:Transcript_70829/g.103786  ORF Transcript_70829/g.103786 Transcript_70829/m.103786 type:complete len:293 (-) Transcript_70829:8-886(-)
MAHTCSTLLRVKALTSLTRSRMIWSSVSLVLSAVSVRSSWIMRESSTSVCPIACRTALRITYDSPICKCGLITDMLVSTRPGISSDNSPRNPAKLRAAAASRASSFMGTQPNSRIISETKSRSPWCAAATTSSTAGPGMCSWLCSMFMTPVTTLVRCPITAALLRRTATAAARASLSLATAAFSSAARAVETKREANSSSGFTGLHTRSRLASSKLRMPCSNLIRCVSHVHVSITRPFGLAAAALALALPLPGTLTSCPASERARSASEAIHLRRKAWTRSALRASRNSEAG